MSFKCSSLQLSFEFVHFTPPEQLEEITIQASAIIPDLWILELDLYQ